jgi:hypothetical protein
MINRVTGEVSFQSGLHIVPHHVVQRAHKTQPLSLKGWMWHIFGSHPSEHGTFEVEAISPGSSGIQIVMVAHEHSFYQLGTPADSERRAFHEGIIATDLGGQREFAWGEVFCRLHVAYNKDWIVVAYNRGADVPIPERDVLLRLLAHEEMPNENT